MVGCLMNCDFERCLTVGDSLMATPLADPLFMLLRLSALGLRDMDYESVIDSSEFRRTYAATIVCIDSFEQHDGVTSYSQTVRGFSMAMYASYYVRQRRFMQAMHTGFASLDILRRAVELDSSNTDADYFLGLYDWARGDLRRSMWWVLFWLPGDRERGVRRLERCMASSCFTSVGAELSLADIYVARGDFVRARSVFDALGQRFPRSRFVWWSLAGYYQARKEPAAAAAVFGRLADAYERVEHGAYNALDCRLRQARLAEDAGDHAAAAAACGRLLERCGTSGEERMRSLCDDARRLLDKAKRHAASE
jgi:tetratricopeptide (TPR) repeat protein